MSRLFDSSLTRSLPVCVASAPEQLPTTLNVLELFAGCGGMHMEARPCGSLSSLLFHRGVHRRTASRAKRSRACDPLTQLRRRTGLGDVWRQDGPPAHSGGRRARRGATQSALPQLSPSSSLAEILRSLSCSCADGWQAPANSYATNHPDVTILNVRVTRFLATGRRLEKLKAQPAGDTRGALAHLVDAPASLICCCACCASRMHSDAAVCCALGWAWL